MYDVVVFCKKDTPLESTVSSRLLDLYFERPFMGVFFRPIFPLLRQSQQGCIAPVEKRAIRQYIKFTNLLWYCICSLLDSFLSLTLW
jgi:hypothetical protein